MCGAVCRRTHAYTFSQRCGTVLRHVQGARTSPGLLGGAGRYPGQDVCLVGVYDICTPSPTVRMALGVSFSRRNGKRGGQSRLCPTGAASCSRASPLRATRRMSGTQVFLPWGAVANPSPVGGKSAPTHIRGASSCLTRGPSCGLGDCVTPGLDSIPALWSLIGLPLNWATGRTCAACNAYGPGGNTKAATCMFPCRAAA